MIGFCFGDDLADQGAVGIADVRAGGVAREMGNKGFGQLFFVGGEELIQTVDVLESTAISKLSTRVDIRPELVLHAPRGLSFFRWLIAFAIGAVAVALTADGIKSFQGLI